MQIKKLYKPLLIIGLIATLYYLSFRIYPYGYYVLNDSLSQDVDNETTGKGIGAYIINMESSKDRFKFISKSVDQLGYPVQRIEAVIGAKLSEQELKDKVDFKTFKTFHGRTPELGAIGCSLSHIKTWQTFLNSNYEYALIFEDDVSFDPHMLKFTVDELVKIRNDWDLVTFDIACNGKPLTINYITHKQDSDIYVKLFSQKLVVYTRIVVLSGGYLINRTAAHNLLKKALPIKMPIDHYFTRAWELDIKFTGMEQPRLVHQTHGSSEIAKTKVLTDEKRTFFEYLKQITFEKQTETIRYLYNWKLFLISKKERFYQKVNKIFALDK